jgi:nucleoside-diphosphate-sugar epimerase
MNTSANLSIEKFLRRDDRVLVLGATGWLGKTSLSFFSRAQTSLLAMASSERTVHFQERTFEIKTQNFEEIEDFQPTLVFDCAFLTQNKLTKLGLEKFVEVNLALIGEAKRVQALPSVRKFIAISSGAAQRFAESPNSSQSSDPYGSLKLQYERVMLNSMDSHENTVMLRPWSMSGPHCGDNTYALYDFIQQAKTGRIEISSEKLVYRRYTAAEDLIFLGMASEPGSEPLDSGGEIVELEELAHRVFAALGLPARVKVSPNRMGEDRYYAHNDAFERLANSLEFTPLSLDQQILLSSHLSN